MSVIFHTRRAREREKGILADKVGCICLRLLQITRVLENSRWEFFFHYENFFCTRI